MKSKVRISLIAGVLFNVNEAKPDYSFYRVEQLKLDQSSGVDKSILLSAIRSIKTADVEKVKSFLTAGTELPGTIQTIESMEEGKGFQPKTAGENGPTCTVNGAPIFMTRVYNPDANAADVLIAHDNTAEIKAWQATQVESKAGLNR